MGITIGWRGVACGRLKCVGVDQRLGGLLGGGLGQLMRVKLCRGG